MSNMSINLKLGKSEKQYKENMIGLMIERDPWVRHPPAPDSIRDFLE